MAGHQRKGEMVKLIMGTILFIGPGCASKLCPETYDVYYLPDITLVFIAYCNYTVTITIGKQVVVETEIN